MLLNLIALMLGALIAVCFALIPVWAQWLFIIGFWGFLAWRAYYA